ncbi:Ferrichrome-iron receptor [Alloalcanivorax xenomutans]|uniref:TonB-dependent siderophore receptor n=1 Tax=Alloalcanivorax xenomutans TaxID=1094342 RepID=UPI0006D5C97D|nr:TonB-dependent siderophore receptor [Alloalcanivorax xenomutans]PHS72105.1 MAG: TonB-dependent siderophore receptor [Alcanivorax sp.]CUR48361.1 Ferrichrome-iron receptor [Alloalcanivorax xenomutans]
MRIWRFPAATGGAVLLSFACCLSLAAGAVSAQSTEPSHNHQHQRVRIALPAQKLGASLAALSRQTGVEIHYPAGAEDEVGNAVNGTMSFDQVLRTLLAGSGLTYTFTENGVEVGRRGEPHRIEAVEVTADTPMEEYAWGAASMGYLATHTGTASKTDAAIVEIPRSISVVTRQEMEDRGANSVMDAMTYSAGVSTELQGIDSRVDDIRIRGFDASSWSNNMYLDGLRLPRGGQWTTAQVDAYGLERVEVLKGPAAVLYGQVTPGGLVNMVAKRPSFDHRNEVILSGGSFNQYEGAFDLGGSLDESGNWLGRLVGSYNDGDAQVDETELSRIYIAPSATWFVNDSTDITFLSYYQKDEGGSTFQFLPVQGLLYPTPYGYIDRDTFLGEPDWNTYDREQWAIGYDLNHTFNDVWSFRQNAKYSYVDTLFRTVVSNPRTTVGNGGLNSNNRTFPRRGVKGAGELREVAVDNQFKAAFSTGRLRHDLVFGLDYLRTHWDHTRYSVTATIDDIDVFDPVYSGAAGFEDSLMVQIDEENVERQTGLYIQDMIALDNWRFMFGVRHDQFKVDALEDEDSSDDDAFTWQTGATYLLENGLAPYLSYATSFEPVSGQDSSQSAFEPSEGEQYEAGLKYQPPHSNSMITISAFDLRQTNLVVTDISPPAGAPCEAVNSCQRQTGETRTRGAELEAKMWNESGLSVTASYTYLDTEVTDGEEGEEGNEKPLAPRNMANLWLDYKWREGALAGFGLGVGARYTSDLYGDAENNYRVDSYVLYDASLRYDMSYLGLPGVSVALTGRNLKDERYLTYCTQYGCSYGSARNITASVKYRW